MRPLVLAFSQATVRFPDTDTAMTSRDVAVAAGTAVVCAAAVYLMSPTDVPTNPVERREAGAKVSPKCTVVKVTDPTKVPT